MNPESKPDNLGNDIEEQVNRPRSPEEIDELFEQSKQEAANLVSEVNPNEDEQAA